MKTHLVTAVALLTPSIAYAQDSETDNPSTVDHRVEPASNTLELAISTGYAQGAGSLGDGPLSVENVSRAGAVVELQAGYRFTPTFAVGAYGSIAAYDNGKADEGNDVFASGAGLLVTAHLAPDHSLDPFVTVSGGWKALYLDPPVRETTVYQGIDFARLQIGVDYRISKQVAIAPVIGGSFGVFVSQKSEMTSGYEGLSGKRVNFACFTGISARFGVGL